VRRLRTAALISVLAIGVTGGAVMTWGKDDSALISGIQVKAGEQITFWDAAIVQPDHFVPGTPKNARRFVTVYVMFDVGPQRIERRLRLRYSGGEGRLALITKAVTVRAGPSSPRCVRARFSVPAGVLLEPLAGSLVDASEPHEMQLKESVYFPPRGSCRTIPIEVDI
jgi:hypothetical protein